ncbi:hypothetical protein DRN93_06125 [archaeon]|nr:MAG: hypothetical protein DRN93_06125 [archaeon]
MEIVDEVGVCVGNGLQAIIANRRIAVKAAIILFIILLLLKEPPYDLIEGHFSNRFAMHRIPPFPQGCNRQGSTAISTF